MEPENKPANKRAYPIHAKLALAWAHMISRCTDPKFKDWPGYGGRGIKVCERWEASFAEFLRDVGAPPSPYHTLGRIDNEGHYEPGNCRWETPKEQANNRRSSRWLTIGNETLTVTQWAERSGIPVSRLYWRLKRGYTPEQILTVRRHSKKRQP